MQDMQVPVGSKSSRLSGVVVGVLGAIGGALLTGSISYISQSNLQRQLEQQRETFERELADANARTDAAKLDAAKTEAARGRLEDHYKAVDQKKEQLKGQYWQLRVTNRVGTPLQVAVESVALDGRSTVSGWYVIQNWSSVIVAATREPDVYVRVEAPQSPNLVCHWYQSTAAPIQIPVGTGVWTQLLGDVFVGQARGAGWFYPYHINGPMQIVDLSIQCQ